MTGMYGGQTAQQRIDGRRRRFLDAGIEVLGTAGWAGATVRAVCAEASLSTRLFYEAYSGLDALTVAVYDEIVDDVFARVAEAVVQGADVDDRAHRAIAALVAGLTDDPRRGRIAMSVGLDAGPLVDRRRDTMERLTDAIELIGRTEHVADDANAQLLRITATLVAGGVAWLMTAFIDARLDVERDVLVRDCARLVLRIGDAAQDLAVQDARTT